MENEYFMGIDPYGYDGNTGSICVIKREEDNDIKWVALYTGRNTEDFEKEMEKLIDFYKPLHIVKEKESKD